MVPGVLATAVAAYVTPLFRGTDPFGGFFVWVVVGFVAGVATVGLASVAYSRRHQATGRVLWVSAAWVLTVGVIVPLILLRTTNTGETSTC